MTKPFDDAAAPAAEPPPSPGPTSARRLQRVTFDYAATEDRVLARMMISDDERHAAWLTQRLLLRLVGALLNHLDKTATADRAITPNRAASTGARTTEPAPKDMLMSFQHQAALMKKEPAPPVAEVDTQNLPLLTAIHARLSKNQIALTMELPAGPAVLWLTHDHTWQLLQILLNLFRRAEWPIDIWPAWMRNESGAAAAQTSNTQVLH